jgi:hypothetical protein
MNEFELARKVKSDDPQEIYNEIFEMIKTDPAMLNEIVNFHCQMLADRVAEIKYTVAMFNGGNEDGTSEDTQDEKR